MQPPRDGFDLDEQAFLALASNKFASAKCPAPDVLRASLEQVLPEELQQQVTAHRVSCPMCTALAETFATAPDEEPSAQELNRMRSRVGLPPVAYSEPAWKRRIWWWIPFPVAAAAALAVFLSTPQPEKAPQEPVAQIPEVSRQAARIPITKAPIKLPLSALVFRGPDEGDSVYLTQLGKALAPYREGRYEESAAELRALASRYPKAAEPQFYGGVSLLLLDRDSEALPMLEAARAAGSDTLKEEIAWYLAVVYDRTGRLAESAELLSRICGTPGPHRTEACEAAKVR